MKHPEYLLLRWNLTTYMLLIMGEKNRMDSYIQSCIAAITNRYSVYDGQKPWYAAVGMTAGRLSQLPECYEDVSRLWAYRYIQPDTHVLTSETVKTPDAGTASSDLENFDVNKFNQEILLEIMRSAAPEEIPNIISEFLLDISEAVRSQPFCHYVMLSTRFTAIQFVTSLGVKQEKLLEGVTCQDLMEQTVEMQDLRRYMSEFLMQAVKIRIARSANQYKDILGRAVDYIDAHFTDDSLSLNMVAKDVNISANYLSAVFTQEMMSTFVEYVTSKRMAKAKELLRTTDKHSGEIALEVGYKDPHYFSFLFKKTQGLTTREYRSGGKH
jgi:two-component system response regulator YesN